MADPLDSVKSLASKYRGWEDQAAAKGELSLSARHAGNAETLEAIIREVEKLRAATQPIPSSYGDLSDLPPSLLKELSGIKADDLEQQLFTIIKNGSDEVELDAILIELWRRFKVEQTRKFLQNKLWRMAQKGMIWTVQGRKGVYTASEPAAPPVRRPPPQPQPQPFEDLDDDVPF